MGTAKFEVIHIEEKLGLITVAQIGHQDFNVSLDSTLEGLQVGDFNQPRMLDSNGSPRLDVFVFALRSAEDAYSLTLGRIVELYTPPGSTARWSNG